LTDAVLETRGLVRRFGALTVTDHVDFSLRAGERRALIGPNGAGKTTFVNLLTGRLAPSAGTVVLGGIDVTRMATHRRVGLGLARTFQINTLLKDTTVIENVQLAVLERRGQGGMPIGGATAQRRAAETAYELLSSLGLVRQAGERVATLAYGRQRLVEVAIALALEPKVLLLDEPAAGVPPADSQVMMEVIAGLPAAIAVLIIEHDMNLVFRFAQTISVLARGRILAEGPPREIAADPRVRDVYLGTRGHG
jgi:branched-chain amino acid transport system ATP-binding protein